MASGKQVFDNTVYGSSSSSGSSQAGIGMGSPSQIAGRMGLRKKSRGRSRGKRK